MSDDLEAFVARELSAPQPAAITDLAARLAAEIPSSAAVLFYGSTLRTGDLDGVQDFYVLTAAPHRRGLRGLANRLLAPEVGYREVDVGGRTLKAKIAVMTISQFRQATAGETLDTTVWARFVQPSALVWTRSPTDGADVRAMIAEAARTAARFAMALGPARGPAGAYWTALFRQTYAAEFRVEPSGREASILAFGPERYDALLPLAWRAAGLPFEVEGGELIPALPPATRATLRRRWSVKRALGKPLNLARLGKATVTFDGAARYAAWKIERHTGIVIAVTPLRERYPLLAAPIVAWKLWRGRKA